MIRKCNVTSKCQNPAAHLYASTVNGIRCIDAVACDAHYAVIQDASRDYVTYSCGHTIDYAGQFEIDHKATLESQLCSGCISTPHVKVYT